MLEESWRRLRSALGAAVAAEPDPRFRVGAMGRAYFAENDPKVRCAELWMQALTEASDDAEIRKFLRKQMREVHDYVSDVIRRSQADGGIYPDRDASAEAWIFIAIGLLGTVGRRVGRLIDDDFPAIVTQRRRWMTGLEDDAGHPGHARHLSSIGPGLPEKRRAPGCGPGGSSLSGEKTHHPARFGGDGPEAVGSAAQPTPPGLLVATSGAPLARTVWRIGHRCKVDSQ